MTRLFDEPDNHTERVDEVLQRATALSQELRTTIEELTQILRAEGEGATSAVQPTNQ